MKERIKIRQAVKAGYIEMDNGTVADISYPKSKLRRGRVQEDGYICPTLTCNNGVHKITREVDDMGKYVYKLRRLTPEECAVLMGLTEEDFQKCRDVGVSESALLKQAGNGIVTNCVELLMEHLYKSQYDSSFVCTDELNNMETMCKAKNSSDRFEQLTIQELEDSINELQS